jgi:hypothetical protein
LRYFWSLFGRRRFDTANTVSLGRRFFKLLLNAFYKGARIPDEIEQTKFP